MRAERLQQLYQHLQQTCEAALFELTTLLEAVERFVVASGNASQGRIHQQRLQELNARYEQAILRLNNWCETVVPEELEETETEERVAPSRPSPPTTSRRILDSESEPEISAPPRKTRRVTRSRVIDLPPPDEEADEDEEGNAAELVGKFIETEETMSRATRHMLDELLEESRSHAAFSVEKLANLHRLPLTPGAKLRRHYAYLYRPVGSKRNWRLGVVESLDGESLSLQIYYLMYDLPADQAVTRSYFEAYRTPERKTLNLQEYEFTPAVILSNDTPLLYTDLLAFCGRYRTSFLCTQAYDPATGHLTGMRRHLLSDRYRIPDLSANVIRLMDEFPQTPKLVDELYTRFMHQHVRTLEISNYTMLASPALLPFQVNRRLQPDLPAVGREGTCLLCHSAKPITYTLVDANGSTHCLGSECAERAVAIQSIFNILSRLFWMESKLRKSLLEITMEEVVCLLTFFAERMTNEKTKVNFRVSRFPTAPFDRADHFLDVTV